MAKRGNQGNGGGPKPIWKTPAALKKDFDKFLESQVPHKIKVLRNIRKLKEGRNHIKNPRSSDYEYTIEEVEELSKQGIVTIVQFAAWKGVHRTTITTGYADGKFKEVYQYMLATCEAFSERRLYEADKNSAGIIFAMKNGYGWTDKSELELSGSVNQPLSEEAKAILAKSTRAEEGCGDE